MFFRLFLLFVFIPAFEIYLLLNIGSLLGALPTVGLVLLTAILGAWLTRRAGLHTLFRIRASLNAGIMPADELFDAFFILIAGFLLITPGFFTDGVGFILLFPPTRQYIKRFIFSRLQKRKNLIIEYYE